MPLYEVEYVISLSTDQKTHFAKSITEIHSQLFTTPSLFVNVRFTDVSHHDIYVGGKPVSLSVSIVLIPTANASKLECYRVKERLPVSIGFRKITTYRNVHCLYTCSLHAQS